jgi:phosphoglycolate phosphatase-like HAD superfamily hydrolase
VVFFDLDGTIIDSSPGITNSVMYALEKFGIEETEREKIYKFIGPPLTDSFARFYGFDDEKSWKAVEYYREYYQDTGIFECSVYPGFEKSLKALKSKEILPSTAELGVFNIICGKITRTEFNRTGPENWLITSPLFS